MQRLIWKVVPMVAIAKLFEVKSFLKQFYSRLGGEGNSHRLRYEVCPFFEGTFSAGK